MALTRWPVFTRITLRTSKSAKRKSLKPRASSQNRLPKSRVTPPTPPTQTPASNKQVKSRAHSSVGQSRRLIIAWSQVQVLLGPPFFPCRCFDRGPVECPHNPARAQGGVQPHWLSGTDNDYAAKLKQAARPAALWRTLKGDRFTPTRLNQPLPAFGCEPKKAATAAQETRPWRWCPNCLKTLKSAGGESGGSESWNWS